MSHDRFSRLRIAVVIGLLAVGLACTPVSSGQNAKPKKLSIHEKLAMEIETKDFTNPMTLKDFLEHLCEMVAKKDVELPILVDIGSFRREDEGAPSPYDAAVQLPSVPKTMTVGEALGIAVSQLPTDNGTMLLRNGRIEILTTEAASLQALLTKKIRPYQLDKVPFADAMRHMSEMTGVSILLDPRMKEKAQTAISADFRGDVPVEAALQMLSDMVELRIVLMEGGVYMTTPCNAESLEKQVRKRKLEREKEKVKAKARDAAA